MFFRFLFFTLNNWVTPSPPPTSHTSLEGKITRGAGFSWKDSLLLFCLYAVAVTAVVRYFLWNLCNYGVILRIMCGSGGGTSIDIHEMTRRRGVCRHHGVCSCDTPLHHLFLFCFHFGYHIYAVYCFFCTSREDRSLILPLAVLCSFTMREVLCFISSHHLCWPLVPRLRKS